MKIDSLAVVERGNGIRTIPLVIKKIGAKRMTTGPTRLPAGAKVPLHWHNCDVQETILEGEAGVEIDGERHRARRFDTTLVPADKPHRFMKLHGITPMVSLISSAESAEAHTLLRSPSYGGSVRRIHPRAHTRVLLRRRINLGT